LNGGKGHLNGEESGDMGDRMERKKEPAESVEGRV